ARAAQLVNGDILDAAAFELARHSPSGIHFVAYAGESMSRPLAYPGGPKVGRQGGGRNAMCMSTPKARVFYAAFYARSSIQLRLGQPLASTLIIIIGYGAAEGPSARCNWRMLRSNERAPANPRRE